MGMPGPLELIVVLLIVLLVFGASKLPDIGRSLGKGIREFKKATKEFDIEEKPSEKEKAKEE